MKISETHIPLEIQTEIIKSLPIKSLICFRSVSKPWKSLIDSSGFIDNYNVNNSHPERLLVSYNHLSHYNDDFLSFVDDDTFPRHRSHLSVPLSIKRLKKIRIAGSSRGLICFCNLERMQDESGTVVLWNPSIRKSITIDVPTVKDSSYQTVVGFGVCPKTSDPKLVKISFTRLPSHSNPIRSHPWLVEIFTLSTRAWRSISIKLPHWYIALRLNDQVVIDGVIYWHAYDWTDAHNLKYHNLLISFDLTSEKFTVISFPPHLKHKSGSLLIYKPTKSLAVVEFEFLQKNYDVWIMDHGVSKSFIKLFTVKEPYSLVTVLEFRKNGEAIIQRKNNNKKPASIWSEVSTKLEAYEPFSENIKDLGICKDCPSDMVYEFFSVTSYTESLLLLDQPEGIQKLADLVIDPPDKEIAGVGKGPTKTYITSDPFRVIGGKLMTRKKKERTTIGGMA